MRIIYRAQSLIDAHLVKDALESADVPAFIAGEYLTGGVGQLPAMDYVAVLVPESSVEAAESVVREIDGALAEARLAIEEQDDDTGTLLPAPG
jgi:Putative prokaryotic signal transducing protein